MGAIALLVAVLIGIVGYQLYARRMDRTVIQADPQRATPARMYNDGVDFMPASGSVLFGYQFKSIAALGPIVGPITAAQWGWLPAIIWLLVGVFFIGWIQDYAAAMMAMRNEGMTMAGLGYKFISPRARTILLMFIYFYLLLIMGAFGSIVAGVLANPAVPVGFIILTLAGVLAGQMTYRWRRDLIMTTVVTVLVAIVGIWVGQTGPVTTVVKNFNALLGSTQTVDGKPVANVLYITPYGPMLWSVFFWGIFALAFCYLGSVLPIWRFAQPVNYVSFWLVAFGIVGAIVGIVLASLGVGAATAAFQIPAYTHWSIASLGPLWPILFVTISCGAVSGWHSLVSTSGTARQLEKETDALPVGAGAMFTEAVLGTLSVVFAATATGIYLADKGYILSAPGGAGGVFAAGMGRFLNTIGVPLGFGSAFGAAFLAIMALTVMQLVLRFMRVASAELIGERVPVFRNPHVGSLVAIFFTLLILWTAFWQRIWVLFGGSNQLFAGLALMLITIWLAQLARPYLWTFVPAAFMYVTTVGALIYTGYVALSHAVNPANATEAKAAFVFGNAVAGLIAAFLVLAALVLAYDGLRSLLQSRRGGETTAPAPAPAGD
jgi:carbon starvation protein